MLTKTGPDNQEVFRYVTIVDTLPSTNSLQSLKCITIYIYILYLEHFYHLFEDLSFCHS